ncbi:hypothetical protein ACFL0H_08015 [Thermodesulfobacteriota bacterium]
MDEEKPYPDITDNAVLERLLPIALRLMEFNRDDKCYTWGETIYEIHKYLETRLNKKKSENSDSESPRPMCDLCETKKEIAQENMDNQSKVVNVFHDVGTVNIYNS